MTVRLALRTLSREARGSRTLLFFFVACLALGVAAVVAVSGLTAGIDRGIRSQARELLAADLAVEAYRPLPPRLDEALARFGGTERTDVVEMPTIAAAPRADGTPGRSQLVELKAVGPAYPFFGTVVLREGGRLSDFLAPDTAVAAPELLSRLGLSVGGTIKLGEARFRVVASVTSEPDRLLGPFSLGPRVFVSHEGLERTGLVRFGSRVLRRALVRIGGPPDAERAAALAAAAKAALGGSSAFRVETLSDAQPNVRQALSRVDRFLGAVALLSLLIGGAGVAQTVRAWLATRLDALAVMKCLGMRPREVLALLLLEVALLSLLASALGAALGTLLLAIVPKALAGALPAASVAAWQPAAVARGLLLGLGVAVLFALPPLAAAVRVPPARVLRRDVEPLPPSRPVLFLVAAGLLGGVLAAAAFQARSLALGALFTAGLVVAAAVLSLLAAGLVTAVTRFRPHALPLWVRQGLASLGRPGAATLPSIVALGIGVLLVVALSVVERHLTRQLSAELPADAPTAFLLDVQPDQEAGVKALLLGQGATRYDSVPVVMARLAAIDGRRVEEIAAERGKAEGESRLWALTREQRLTWGATLPADNRVVAGKLFADPGVAEASLEQEFARQSLGVDVGARLTFDLQGVPVDLVVTSLRSVDWRTFGINFFFVVEPGVLEKAPHFRMVAARLPRGGEERVQDLLARDFPNVTVIRTREVLEKIASVLGRLGTAVRALGGFAVLTGAVLLGGAVAAASSRRSREAALLKVLGVTRAGVAGVFAVEDGLVGLAAGIVGTAGGHLLAWAVVTNGLELPWRLDPVPLLAGPIAAALLAAAAGLIASLGPLRRRPLDALRHE